GAAAMLGASINYPMRGAVAFKSTVGTNVASDALSNLASAGVKGGTVLVLGEDYGEGASIIQERTHAFAMKSQIWLVDPRPNLPKIVEMVEKSFELSEISSTPVMLELRIRACHVQGTFKTKPNQRPLLSKRSLIENPDFDYNRICLPPATYLQEKLKVDVRWPAAVKFIRENKLNEIFPGEMNDIGILCLGGMYNAVIRALQTLGFADAFGNTKVPIYCMNVTYPMVPEEVMSFCSGKREVLIVEEGQPAYIEDAVLAALRRADINGVKIRGKDVLPLAGEYTGEVVLTGIAKFLGRDAAVVPIAALKKRAGELLGGLPQRPPGFCVGCPERPVFSAMKLLERDNGKFHVSADIGCHLFSTLPPFNIGNTVLGYGLGLASNSAVHPAMARRSVTIMGDGGFWHNGLTTGIANSVFNKNDGILVIMKNGYSSATGTQELPSSPQHSDVKEDISMERALEGIGVPWMKTVHNYHVGEVAKTIKEAMDSPEQGLKVIIAEGECQLERQRKLRPVVAEKMKRGERHVRVKYGVDEDTCTGDHSCIRLSGCPTLTIKDNPDPLRTDPVATVIDGCVGCGLCGENAHAAVLCPSFYRAEVIQNPTWWDKLWNASSPKK
ncbi:MAG TPA: indolepyruvate ferredoxin oxidoreductase subunit alpha, partial [Burkholderiales bacterium]|nr:indolepyruvate ferredoxin oxidoreductase subunit alpha [Burkholderiales bacterium]